MVHLHRRTVFGASWNEVQRDVASDPKSAVTRILDGQCRSDGVPDGFRNLANIIGSAAADSGSNERLKAWWIYQVMFSPHPLEERLTLMWHNHFATSNLKVNDLKLMRQQNNVFRRYALSPFGDLLRAMSQDPALLLWLDAQSNKAGQANENFARELMELFTLGVFHYNEADVKEVARALTGWTVKRGEFLMQDKLHDAGIKSFLSQTGNFNGDDVVRILLEQPATSRRLIARTNYAKAMVDGHLCSPTKPLNLMELVSEHGSNDSSQSNARWLALALCNNTDSDLIQAVTEAVNGEGDREQNLARVVFTILSKPEAHLH